MARRRRQVRRAGRRPGVSNPRDALRWAGLLLVAGVGGYLRQSWQRRRTLGPREALVWIAVAVVAGAFLLLLAQQALGVAVLAGLVLVAFAWWELTRPR